MGKAWSCQQWKNQPPGVFLSVHSQASQDLPTIPSLHYQRNSEPFDGSWYAESDKMNWIESVAPVQSNGWYHYKVKNAEFEKWKGGDMTRENKADFSLRIRSVGRDEPGSNSTVHEAVVEFTDPFTRKKKTEIGECVLQGWVGKKEGAPENAGSAAKGFVPEVSKLK